MQLVNANTGSLEDVPQDKAQSSFLSGQYGIPNDTKPILVDPTGSFVTVDPGDAHTAVTQSGYRFPNESELNEFQAKQQYGSHPFVAAGLGAAQTATFGLSNLALTKSGLVDPKTIAGLEKYNPVASTVGQVGGIFGPGALGLGVKAVGTAGRAATGAVESILPEATNIAGKAVRNAIAKGAGSAVEGAFYGAGQVVNEYALGDPNLNAEMALGQIGLSGLLGGGFGAALGLGEVGLPPLVDTAKGAIQSVYNTARGLGEKAYAKTASAVSGFEEQNILQALQNRGVQFLSKEEKAEAASQLGKALNDQHGLIEDLNRTVNKDIKPEVLENLVQASNIPSQVSKDKALDIYKEFSDGIKALADEPDNYAKGYAKKVQDIADGMQRDLGQDEWNPSDFFKTLNESKQKLQEIARPLYSQARDSIPLLEKNSMQLVDGLSKTARSTLEDENVFGKAASVYAKFNDAQAEYLNSLNGKGGFSTQFMRPVSKQAGVVGKEINPNKINSFFNKVGTDAGDSASTVLSRHMAASQGLLDQIEGLYKELPDKAFDKDAIKSVLDKNTYLIEKAQQQSETSNLYKGLMQPGSGEANLETAAAASLALHHPVVGAALEAYNALKNPGKTIQRLANLERVVQKTASEIENGVRVLVSGSSKAFNITKGEIASGIAKDFGKDSAKTEKLFEKRKNDINKYSQNPQILNDTLIKGTEGLYPHAPDTTMGMQRVTSAGISFLASKLPQHMGLGALSPDWKPTRDEVAKFHRYYEVVENPTNVLKQAASGTLTPEALEVMQNVYPRMYDQMKREVFERMVKQKQPIPYRSRMMMSMFMGQDVDGSTNSSMIMGNQLAYTMPSAKPVDPMMQIKPSQKGLGDLTLAERSMTEREKTFQEKA